mmetsp:Transcript_134843/g.319656  ORF Transcript_134843/g.319656 Transcript_134843/m.319656 type:complete len:132 (-) Transcript_134843:6-401(-)
MTGIFGGGGTGGSGTFSDLTGSGGSGTVTVTYSALRSGRGGVKRAPRSGERGAEAFGRDGVTGSGTLRGVQAQERGDGGTAGFALQCSGSTDPTDPTRNIGTGLMGLGKGRSSCRVGRPGTCTYAMAQLRL